VKKISNSVGSIIDQGTFVFKLIKGHFDSHWLSFYEYSQSGVRISIMVSISFQALPPPLHAIKLDPLGLNGYTWFSKYSKLRKMP